MAKKKNEIIYSAADFDNAKKINDDGNEYWSARELCKLFGYSEYRNFKKFIEKINAELRVKNEDISSYNDMINDMIIAGKGAHRDVEDYHLYRKFCLLISQKIKGKKDIAEIAEDYFSDTNANSLVVLSQDDINDKIVAINNIQVMLDYDLAELYQVETKVLNQAVKRNIDRFPSHFLFKLSESEKNELVTNCDRFKNLKHSSILPYAFTEQGISMLSAVLNSKTAIKVSIEIMDAFVKMRKILFSKNDIFDRIINLEKNQIATIAKESEYDKKFNELFTALETKDKLPDEGIFFDGQIYDAYAFVANLIKRAKKSIILIDGYIDESVLTLLSKNKNNIEITLYTQHNSKVLKQDIKKYNKQYKNIKVLDFNNSHDRFLIIDKTETYHIGASLKDLGKKWFAFSKFDKSGLEILNKL